MYYYRFSGNDSELIEIWKNLLKWFSDYSLLFNNGTIKRGGAYYPRLADTNKRGVRAFNELRKMKSFKETPEYFDIILKCREVPIIGIDYIQTKTDIRALFPDKLEIEISEEPFELIEEDLNLVPFEEKVKVITDYFESLEFTPAEMAKTLSLLNNYLCEVIS